MGTRRQRIWLHSLSLVLAALFLTAAALHESTGGLLWWSLLGIASLLNLVRAVRNRPYPVLTMQRIVVLRRQAVAMAVAGSAAAVVVLVLRPAAQRSSDVVIALFVAVPAVLGVFVAVRTTRILRSGEIPPHLVRGFEEREHARRLRG